MQQVYKLYATGAANTDGAASMDIRADGTIVGVLMLLTVNGGAAAADGGGMEISFQSTSGHGTNDTTGSIAALYSRGSVVTTGGLDLSRSQYVPMDVPVSSGERIFLHLLEYGTVTGVFCWCFLYIEEKSGSNRPRIARR